MRFVVRSIIAACIVALGAATAVAREPIKFPERQLRPGFQGLIADAGPIYISGQPSEAALRDLIGRERITTVINIRTREEINNRREIPYDELAVVTELGAAYFNIPLGGADNPYTPQALNAFIDAFHGAPGKVLLHCTVGARASSLWSAYLIRYHNADPVEAIRHATAINLPPEWDVDNPTNRLLGVSPTQP